MNRYLIKQAILKLSPPIVMAFLLAAALHSLTTLLSNAHEPLGHFYRHNLLKLEYLHSGVAMVILCLSSIYNNTKILYLSFKNLARKNNTVKQLVMLTCAGATLFIFALSFSMTEQMDFYARIFITTLTAIFCTMTIPLFTWCLLPKSIRKVSDYA